MTTKPDWAKFRRDFVRGIMICVVAMAPTGCGLLGSEATKTALDIARGPAIDVLTKVIADRYGSDIDKASAYCEELPTGFRSGIEELDDDERGAFIMCWARSGEE